MAVPWDRQAPAWPNDPRPDLRLRIAKGIPSRLRQLGVFFTRFTRTPFWQHDRLPGWSLAVPGGIPSRFCRIGCVFPIFFACLLFAGEPGTDPRVSVGIAAAPAEVDVGNAVTVTVTYRWPLGLRPATEPDPGPNFTGCFVTSVAPVERIEGGDEHRRVHKLTVAAMQSGAWALPRPSFSVAATGVKDAPAITAQAPAVIVQVGAKAAAVKLPAARPAWTRPPAPPAVRQRGWWIAAAAVAVLGIGLAIWFALRKRTPPPTPFEIFDRDLAHAETASEGKELGARLSLALRRCAGIVYGFDGVGSTTREAAAWLRSAGNVPADEGRSLIRLLERLDEHRWSPGDLPADVVRPVVRESRDWATAVDRRLSAEAAARSGGKRNAEAAQQAVPRSEGSSTGASTRQPS